MQALRHAPWQGDGETGNRRDPGLRLRPAGHALALAAALVLALGVPSGARAADGEGCTAAAWSLATDGARMAAPDLPHAAAGTPLAATEPRAVVLTLAPAAAAHLPFAPERAPAAGTFAGHVLLVPPATGGVVQITLAQAAWIDLLSAGAPLQPQAFTGVRDCPLARKSVRFLLPAGAGPLVLEVSGAPAPTLVVAVSMLP